MNNFVKLRYFYPTQIRGVWTQKDWQIFFWHLKGNDLLIKERTVWANLLISYVLQYFGISFILILNVNLFILSIIISFWFWLSRRLQSTIRLVECEMQINSTWLQTLSISRTYWILTDFYGGMIRKKKQKWLQPNIKDVLRSEPYRSVRSNSEPTEAFTRQSEALRSVGPSEMVPTPD